MAGAAEGVPPEEWREWAGCGSPSRGGSPRLHVGTSLAGPAAIEMYPLPPPAPPAGEAMAVKAGLRREDWRDWAKGLPVEVLAKVAEKHIAQTEAGEAARLKQRGVREELIQERMADRKRKGNCLFVFARVCREWRKAQLKVGGPLRTRAHSDVIMPGSVALAKWALAEGFPMQISTMWTMAHEAAAYGQLELVKWLFGEGGFEMDEEMNDDRVTNSAASSGNLELVRWLRGKGCDWSTWTCRSAAEAGRLGVLQWLRTNGCPWDKETCDWAVDKGHVEVLRWARENGCLWTAGCRDWAAEKLGYTDDRGNLVD